MFLFAYPLLFIKTITGYVPPEFWPKEHVIWVSDAELIEQAESPIEMLILSNETNIINNYNKIFWIIKFSITSWISKIRAS